MLMMARQIAEHTQFDVQTIYRWAREGVLPCYRRGSGVRFKLEEVEQAMKEETKCQKRKNEEP